MRKSYEEKAQGWPGGQQAEQRKGSEGGIRHTALEEEGGITMF